MAAPEKSRRRTHASREQMSRVQRQPTSRNNLPWRALLRRLFVARGDGMSGRRTSAPYMDGPLRLALSVEEACAALGVSWDFWNEHIAADIRIVRRGRRKLIPIQELERWLREAAERALEGP